MKKTVITDQDGVILAVGTGFGIAPDDDQVMLLNGCGYRIFGQKAYQDVEVPNNVEAQIYTYDGTTFVPYQPERDKIVQRAIDSYTEELLEGGVL